MIELISEFKSIVAMGFWPFIGVLILLGVVGSVLCRITAIIVTGLVAAIATARGMRGKFPL